jgi:hypothetical protein
MSDDLVSLVMKVAASELLHQEAIQVDQDMEELLAEMALVPNIESRLDDFTLRFFELLKRRSKIAQRALGIANTGSLRTRQTGPDALSDQGPFQIGEHPIIWNTAFPDSVVVSRPCWCR